MQNTSLTVSFSCLFIVIATASVRADAFLDDGLNRLAREVAVVLEKEGGNSINVGDFIAPPRLRASGGAGLKLQIAEALKSHEIQVDRLVLRATASTSTSTSTAVTAGPATAIRFASIASIVAVPR